MKVHFADDFERRNPENYNAQLSLVEQGHALWSTYGIKRKSILNELNNCHVTRCLPPDFTHDFGEGVVPYELALALNDFINVKKYFKFEFLLNQLKNFKFGTNDQRNVTDFIHVDFAKKGTIGGNATKNLYLLRFLPLLIGSLIPEDDFAWLCVISLKQIVEMVLRRHVTVYCFGYCYPPPNGN